MNTTPIGRMLVGPYNDGSMYRTLEQFLSAADLNLRPALENAYKRLQSVLDATVSGAVVTTPVSLELFSMPGVGYVRAFVSSNKVEIWRYVIEPQAIYREAGVQYANAEID